MSNEPKEYLAELNEHFSHLYAFARQINELDFAASLAGEFRGAQDPGWATTITANEVFDEIVAFSSGDKERTKAEVRTILMLYCQLAEAGGFYETLKNIMGIVEIKPYLLWPFKNLVRIKNSPRRIIGPNANATFKDLAETAENIGLTRLSSLLELAFRDDIRNAISHADYVIWTDELRLRKRNGGNATKISFEDVNHAITRGIGFFQLLRECNATSIRSFNPEKKIVGRLSANPPMEWRVSYEPNKGSFSLSSSAPGGSITPQYQRQVEINGRLGGKVLAVYTKETFDSSTSLLAHILAAGFEPHEIVMNAQKFDLFIEEIENLALWDERVSSTEKSEVVLASPWGFRWIQNISDFDSLLGLPLVNIEP